MKRILASIVLISLIMVFITGCGGISQTKYDLALKQTADLKTQLTDLTAELTDTLTELSNTKVDLIKNSTELELVRQDLVRMTADRDSLKTKLHEAVSLCNFDNAEFVALNQTLAALNSSIKAAQPYVDVAAVWLELWNSNYTETVLQKMNSAILSTGDSTLKAAWDTVLTTTGDSHVAAEWAFINRLLQQLTVTFPRPA